MPPLRERILCDLLFGIECRSCRFDNAHRGAETDKYMELPPRLHVFILLGLYGHYHVSARHWTDRLFKSIRICRMRLFRTVDASLFKVALVLVGCVLRSG